MDGFRGTQGPRNIVIAATNRQDSLDKALLRYGHLLFNALFSIISNSVNYFHRRSGRFDYHIFVPKPNKDGRKEILLIQLKKVALSSNLEMIADFVADQTHNFTGADLANVVNTSALLAARRGAGRVEIADFKSALAKIFSERVDLDISSA
jgi:cell division protease FtsH